MIARKLGIGNLSLNRIISIYRLQKAQIAEKSRIVNKSEIGKVFKSRPDIWHPDIQLQPSHLIVLFPMHQNQCLPSHLQTHLVRWAAFQLHCEYSQK